MSRVSTTTSGDVPNPGPLPTPRTNSRYGETTLSARTLQGIPETAAQRVPGLVVQQRIDRQRRVLEQPRFQVRWHARLAGQDRLQPQRRGLPGHRLTEFKPLRVGGLDRVGD